MPSVDCFFSSWPSRTPSPRNDLGLPVGVFLAAALLLLGAHASAWAQTESRRAATPADSLPRSAPAHRDSLHRAKPFTVMLRSAAVPGWGQVYNHKYVKA